jgi:hypothetical protein
MTHLRASARNHVISTGRDGADLEEATDISGSGELRIAWRHFDLSPVWRPEFDVRLVVTSSSVHVNNPAGHGGASVQAHPLAIACLAFPDNHIPEIVRREMRGFHPVGETLPCRNFTLPARVDKRTLDLMPCKRISPSRRACINHDIKGHLTRQFVPARHI